MKRLSDTTKNRGSWRYCSLRSLIKTGDVYGAEFCYHTMPELLDPFDTETFKKDPMEFYIGATDVVTGEIRFHKCTDGGPADIEWMRASASMPVVSNIVSVDGYKMLDGGIVCSVPYEYMEQQGYDRNVIVLTRQRGYRKRKSDRAAGKAGAEKVSGNGEGNGGQAYRL